MRQAAILFTEKMSMFQKKRITPSRLGCRPMSVLLCAALFGMVGAVSLQAAPLEPGAKRSIVAQVELQGQLKLNADGSGVKTRKLQLTGRLEYDDIVLRMTEDGEIAQSLRNLRQSTAKLVVGKWQTSPNLSTLERPIVAHWNGSRIDLYSPSAPMNSTDLDAVSLQIDPVALSLLFPADQRAELTSENPAGSWQVSNAAAAALMGWDVCSEQSLECRVVRRDATREVVLLEIEGELLGAIDGATSEANVKGKLNYDPRSGQCTWADVSIEEKRAVGHVAPGLEAKARIRVLTKPAEAVSAGRLRELLASISPQPQPTDLYLAFASQRQGFELMHSRDWKLMVDGPLLTIFRLIQDGDLIAQANVSRIRATERPTLKEFQQEVSQALGKRLEKFVSVDEETRDDGTRVYRVMAAGTVESLPIQWVYLHFRNGDQAVTCAITMDARLVERFAGADERLVATLRVTDLPAPQEARKSGGTEHESARQRR